MLMEKVLDTSVFLWQISLEYLFCSNISKLTVEKPKYPRWPFCSLTFLNSLYINLASTIYDESLRYFPFQTFKYLKIQRLAGIRFECLNYLLPLTPLILHSRLVPANTFTFPKGTFPLELRRVLQNATSAALQRDTLKLQTYL